MTENDIEDGEVLEAGDLESKQTKSIDFSYQRMKRPRPEEIKTKRARCKYWPGSCHKAQDCPYLHDGYQNLKDDLCKYISNDTCLKGDGCVFSHDTKKFPCKYFHGVGLCNSGDTCKFSHVRLTPSVIPKFIKDNEVFLQTVQQTRGYTNLGEYYLNYLREKMQNVPLLPLPITLHPYTQQLWIPKPPSPDMSSRLHASGIIKNRNITVPKVDISRLRRQNLNNNKIIKNSL
jgi:RNA-binding, Nab2-type zinc finger